MAEQVHIAGNLFQRNPDFLHFTAPPRIDLCSILLYTIERNQLFYLKFPLKARELSAKIML